MRLFAIADPHLSAAKPKPMEIFGPSWQGHPEAFFNGWREVVQDDDVVLIPGDISWAMHLKDALVDLRDIAALPGTKILLRGNHDYWWSSISKVRKALPETMLALQHDAIRCGDVVIAGTRGWVCPGSPQFDEHDHKIYLREVERLKLSLKAAAKLSGSKLVVMLHYPPTNMQLEPSGFSEVLTAAVPDVVVFGHLHNHDGQRALPEIAQAAVHLVAADALGFVPKLILP